MNFGQFIGGNNPNFSRVFGCNLNSLVKNLPGYNFKVLGDQNIKVLGIQKIDLNLVQNYVAIMLTSYIFHASDWLSFRIRILEKILNDQY